MNKLKLLAAFLLGFTVWVPFLFLALDLSPFKLVLSDYGMWGWEMKDWAMPEPGHPVLGSYTGIGILLFGYFAYIAVVILAGIIVDFGRAKTEQIDKQGKTTFWSWYPQLWKSILKRIAKSLTTKPQVDPRTEEAIGFWGTLIGCCFTCMFLGPLAAVVWFIGFHLVFVHSYYRRKVKNE